MQIGNGSPLSIRREWKKAQDHGHHRVVATDLSCLRVMMMMTPVGRIAGRARPSVNSILTRKFQGIEKPKLV